MAFLLNKTSIASRFRSQPQKTEGAFVLQRRGFHVELGAREKALLAEDPALRRFKSYKNTIRRIRKVGDALTIVVLAGCCYEIYVRTVTREEARKQAVGRQ